MRTFVAIDIPSDIRLKIAEFINALRPGANNVRWTKPEAMHITLKFLGEVTAAQLETIKMSLASVRADAPFDLTIEGAGCFPNERSPRVLWLGVEGGAALQELAERVEKCLQPLGFAKEDRPYSAHLTLGRVREPGEIVAVQKVLRQGKQLAFGSFTANQFFLYESRPSAGGSLYLKLAGFEISPGR